MKFLGELVPQEADAYRKDKLNLVVASTGAGKTTMATKELPKILGVKEKSRVLFLIDTNMGRDNLYTKNVSLFQRWGETQNKIVLMNYYKFGQLIFDREISGEMFDLVVADEFHNLYKYAKIDMAKIIGGLDDSLIYDKATVSMVLSRTSRAYLAMETIKRWAQWGDNWIFAMTATPERFLRDKEMTEFIEEVKKAEGEIVYSILEKNSYADPNKLLTASDAPEKRLIFANSVKQAKDFANTINTETKRKAIELHSTHNDTYPMTVEQLAARDYLCANERFPPDINDIVATEAYATGWNLQEDEVGDIIVHSGNEEVIKQFRGRLRGNLNRLYTYDSSAGKKEIEKKRREIKDKYTVPAKWLGRWLDANERKQLIKKIKFPKAWTSLRKYLEENGYKIEKDTHGNCMISK